MYSTVYPHSMMALCSLQLVSIIAGIVQSASSACIVKQWLEKVACSLCTINGPGKADTTVQATPNGFGLLGHVLPHYDVSQKSCSSSNGTGIQ